MKSNLLQRISLTLIMLTIVFSSGLHGIAKYKAIPLQYLHDTASSTKDQNVSFTYKQFNVADCREYLGRSKVIRKGYQPIQIQVTNNTNDSFEFSPANFSFPCIPYYNVVEHINFNTTSRLVGWGIGALFIWPLVIPFILEAIECPRAHDNLEYDFAQKALSQQVIKPQTRINGVIFVAQQHFKPSFSFTLINQRNNEKVTLSTSTQQSRMA